MKTAFEEEKKTIIYPAWRDKRAHIFTVGDFLSALAMFAVRQSPYDFPENLTEGLAMLKARLMLDFKWEGTVDFIYRRFTCEEIKVYLCKIFDEETVFKKWNSPKVGKHTTVYVDRYSKPMPDHDFIDTGALARNISHILFIEKLHWEDQPTS